jgi:hypothetical protein
VLTRIGHPQYTIFSMILLGLIAACALPRRLVEPTSLLSGTLPAMSLAILAFMTLLRSAAMPPEGFSVSASQLALDHVPRRGSYYGPETAGMLASPIFRRDATFYPQVYAFNVRPIMESGAFPPPRPFEPDSPPDVMVVDAPGYRKALLERFAAMGAHYEQVGRNVWARTR